MANVITTPQERLETLLAKHAAKAEAKGPAQSGLPFFHEIAGLFDRVIDPGR